MARIMICGSTLWEDDDYIRKIVSKFNKKDTVIHGKLIGVEFLVNFYAHLIDLPRLLVDPPVFKDGYSERLYTIYIKSKPDKILIIDNEYESSEMYNFIKFVDQNSTEIIVIKSVMFH